MLFYFLVENQIYLILFFILSMILFNRRTDFTTTSLSLYTRWQNRKTIVNSDKKKLVQNSLKIHPYKTLKIYLPEKGSKSILFVSFPYGNWLVMIWCAEQMTYIM